MLMHKGIHSWLYCFTYYGQSTICAIFLLFRLFDTFYCGFGVVTEKRDRYIAIRFQRNNEF